MLESLLHVLLWLVGILFFLSFMAWTTFGKLVDIYSMHEQPNFADQDFWHVKSAIDSEFYSRIISPPFYCIVLVTSLIGAILVVENLRGWAIFVVITGLLAQLVYAWLVVLRAADEVAREFGYTRKLR